MARSGHTPIRSCKVCRTRKPQQDLQRWVLDGNGRVIEDKNQKLSGRGAYVCSQDCYNKIQQQLPRLLSRRIKR